MSSALEKIVVDPWVRAAGERYQRREEQDADASARRGSQKKQRKALERIVDHAAALSNALDALDPETLDDLTIMAQAHGPCDVLAVTEALPVLMDAARRSYKAKDSRGGARRKSTNLFLLILDLVEVWETKNHRKVTRSLTPMKGKAALKSPSSREIEDQVQLFADVDGATIANVLKEVLAYRKNQKREKRPG